MYQNSTRVDIVNSIFSHHTNHNTWKTLSNYIPVHTLTHIYIYLHNIPLTILLYLCKLVMRYVIYYVYFLFCMGEDFFMRTYSCICRSVKYFRPLYEMRKLSWSRLPPCWSFYIIIFFSISRARAIHIITYNTIVFLSSPISQIVSENFLPWMIFCI